MPQRLQSFTIVSDKKRSFLFQEGEELSEGSPFGFHQCTVPSLRPVDGRWKSERCPKVGFDQRWWNIHARHKMIGTAVRSQWMRRQRMQRWKTG